MATTLEDYTTEEQSSVVRFFSWAKGLNARDIHKEMFPVYGGKCLSGKALYEWIEKRRKPFADDKEVEPEARKWLREQSKDLYAPSYDALVKRWDKCINVGGGYVERNKCVFPPRFEYHIFYILYPFVTYLLTLSRSSVGIQKWERLQPFWAESSTVTKARCEEFQRRSTQRRQTSRWGNNTPNGWVYNSKISPSATIPCKTLERVLEGGGGLMILERRKEFIRRLQRLGTTIPLILERVMTHSLNRHKKNHEESSKHRISFLFIP
jgi:hypothetical protein